MLERRIHVLRRQLRDIDESKRVARASRNTARTPPSGIQKMRAHGALLGKVEDVVPVNDAVGTSVHELMASARPLAVEDDDSVIATIGGIGVPRCLSRDDARRVLALLAHDRHALLSHARSGCDLLLAYLNPELPFLLGGGQGTPIVIAVLVLARYLAIAALDAQRRVYQYRLHESSPLFHVVYCPANPSG